MNEANFKQAQSRLNESIAQFRDIYRFPKAPRAGSRIPWMTAEAQISTLPLLQVRWTWFASFSICGTLMLCLVPVFFECAVGCTTHTCGLGCALWVKFVAKAQCMCT